MKNVIVLLMAAVLAGCGAAKSASNGSSSDNHLRAKSISVGGDHTCSVGTHSAKCWGKNNGAFGDGSTTDSLIPKIVDFGLNVLQSLGFQKVQTQSSAMVKISATYYRSCGIIDGAAFCWGGNTWGQNGDGTTTDTVDPVAVTGMDSDVTEIVTGVHHTCAIKDGALYCWGANGDGQLGDGNTNTESHVPVAVLGMGTGVTAVGVGYFHTCAIKDGDVYCWGQGANGPVGDGDLTGHEVLTATLVAGTTGATALATGDFHSCAVVAGVMQCWGNDRYGQLGDNMGGPFGHGTDSVATPQTVVNLTNISQVAAGPDYTCVLDSGNVYCFGANNTGNLGLGAAAIGVDQYSPVQISSLTGFQSISIGVNTVCGIAADDSVVCWGENQNGQLGDGTTTNQSEPTFTLESEE